MNYILNFVQDLKFEWIGPPEPVRYTHTVSDFHFCSNAIHLHTTCIQYVYSVIRLQENAWNKFNSLAAIQQFNSSISTTKVNFPIF